MDAVAWILGVILVVAGVVVLIRGRSSRPQIVRGVALILAGLIAVGVLPFIFD